MIRLISVWKAFGAVPALRNVSLAIEPGEAVLLTGPSGAGKSTLLRLLFAAEHADQGQVLVADRDLSRLRRASIPYLRRNVGIVFQDFKLIRDRTARDNVALALEILGLPAHEIRRRSDEALASVGLLGKERLRAFQLSGGEQQRVAVARAVVARPAILLADEPTGNLDPRHADELLVHFEALRRAGMTMVIATHDHDVMRFGAAHGWRSLRLEAGALVDAVPVGALPHEPTQPTGPYDIGDDVVEIVEPPLTLRVVS